MFGRGESKGVRWVKRAHREGRVAEGSFAKLPVSQGVGVWVAGRETVCQRVWKKKRLMEILINIQ